MKEIGKLIELLNEYGHTSNCGPFETCRLEPATDYTSSYLVLSWDDNGEGDWKDWVLEVPRLISKEYGFIKWLVDNDKIEGETIGNYQSRTKLRTLTHTAGLWHDAEGKSELEYIKETFTDGLLMLLSISDTPIEDLVSYLK